MVFRAWLRAQASLLVFTYGLQEENAKNDTIHILTTVTTVCATRTSKLLGFSFCKTLEREALFILSLFRETHDRKDVLQH